MESGPHLGGWVEILEGVFFTPVISMIRSSDPFIFTSSELPNTDVCHRTISSNRKYKYCNVRECTATVMCCSRCATKTIKKRGIQQHCVPWLNADAAIVSRKYQTKSAHREYRTEHQAEEIRLVTKYENRNPVHLSFHTLADLDWITATSSCTEC